MTNLVPLEHHKSAGIYQLLNTTNGKCYIGSTVNFSKRFRSHKSLLSRQKHPNRFLMRAFANDGHAFVYNLLQVIEHNTLEPSNTFEHRLRELEEYYIHFFKSNIDTLGYNLRNVSNSNLGLKLHLGESHGNSKITGDIALTVKILLSKNWKQSEISIHLNISLSIIESIAASKSWNFIEPSELDIKSFIEPPHPTVPRKNLHNQVVDCKTALAIRILIIKGWQPSEIKALYKISHSLISSIISGHSWKKSIPTQQDIDKFETPNKPDGVIKHLNHHQVKIAKVLILKGYSPSVIGSYLYVRPKVVANIKCGKFYKNIIVLDEQIDRIWQSLDMSHLELSYRKATGRGRSIQ